jgi:transcription elongation factor GreB
MILFNLSYLYHRWILILQYKNYITPEGYEELKYQLHNYVSKDRPILVKTVAWAASNGDRSENADYIYGKKKLRELDKQIQQLTKKLSNCEVVNYHQHKDRDTVFFGATVRILRNNTLQQVVKIVGEDEISHSKNHISWRSPLATQLISKKLGDCFFLSTPSGTDEIEVLEITY